MDGDAQRDSVEVVDTDYDGDISECEYYEFLTTHSPSHRAFVANRVARDFERRKRDAILGLLSELDGKDRAVRKRAEERIVRFDGAAVDLMIDELWRKDLRKSDWDVGPTDDESGLVRDLRSGWTFLDRNSISEVHVDTHNMARFRPLFLRIGEPAGNALVNLLNSDDSRMVLFAASVLIQMREFAVPALVDLGLRNKDHDIRKSSHTILGAIGNASLPYLRERLERLEPEGVLVLRGPYDETGSWVRAIEDAIESIESEGGISPKR